MTQANLLANDDSPESSKDIINLIRPMMTENYFQFKQSRKEKFQD